MYLTFYCDAPRPTVLTICRLTLDICFVLLPFVIAVLFSFTSWRFIYRTVHFIWILHSLEIWEEVQICARV